jgi:hypothetical protein
VIVVADGYKNQVALASDKEDSQLEAGSALKESSYRADPYSGMLVRPTKTFLEATYRILDAMLLLWRQLAKRTLERWPVEDHFLQGLSLPAFRSESISRHTFS